MSEPTPLQVLDDAVETFLRATDQLGEGGFVTGWAIGVSKARIQADDDASLPMVSGATYVFGPQTSIIQLAGLAKYLEVIAEKVTWQQLSDSNDDE